jgi:tetratricopeptide (TPR) repeat protein
VQGSAIPQRAKGSIHPRCTLALWDRFIQSGNENEKRAQELWERAQKYFEGKLYNRALKDLSDAITLNPGLAREAMELMNVFSAQGSDEQALSVGLALLKVENQNPELMNRLANTLRKLGSFSRAKKLYTMAIKLDPHNKEYKYNLAACSFAITASDGELVRQTRAVEAYTEPRRYGFQGTRQDFYPIPNQVLEDEKSRGKKKEAEEPEQGADTEMDEESRAQMVELMVKQLKEDISASQGAWEDEYNLGLFYDLVGYGELAIQHLTRAHELAEDHPEPGNNLGVAVLAHKQDLTQAETILLKNLSRHKFDRTTVLNLAVLYRQQPGKGFQTLKYYVYLGDLLAKSLGEFDTGKMEQHAQDLFQRRKYLEAVPIFENLAREKQEEYWYEKLAVMFFNQKKEDLYIKALKDLLRIAPENDDAAKKVSSAAQTYEDQAHERIAKGNKRMAIQLLEKAVKIEESAERWVELAQLYEDEGEEILMDNAIRKWKQLSGQDAEQAQPTAAEGEAVST